MNKSYLLELVGWLYLGLESSASEHEVFERCASERVALAVIKSPKGSSAALVPPRGGSEHKVFALFCAMYSFQFVKDPLTQVWLSALKKEAPVLVAAFFKICS